MLARPENRRTPAPAPPLTEVGLVGAALQPHAPRGALDQEVPHQLAGQVAGCGGHGGQGTVVTAGPAWGGPACQGLATAAGGRGSSRTGGRQRRVDGRVPSVPSSDQAGRAGPWALPGQDREQGEPTPPGGRGLHAAACAVREQTCGERLQTVTTGSTGRGGGRPRTGTPWCRPCSPS